MRRIALCGVGAILICLAAGCSGEDTGPGSEIAQTKGGKGGSGGQAGSLDLDTGARAGGGMGGMGGSNGGAAGSATAGSAMGGTASHAGTSSGSGSGGAKPAGMCKRVAGSDADCLDFYPAEPPDPARPQAYTCDDTGAFGTLSSQHGGKCASVSFVPGSRYGACCPP